MALFKRVRVVSKKDRIKMPSGPFSNPRVVIDFMNSTISQQREREESKAWEKFRLAKNKEGSLHPTTLSSLQSLVMGLRNWGKPSVAEKILSDELKLHKEVLIYKDPRSLTALLGALMAVFVDQRKQDEAEQLWQSSLALFEEKFSSNDPSHIVDLRETFYQAHPFSRYSADASSSFLASVQHLQQKGPEVPPSDEYFLLGGMVLPPRRENMSTNIESNSGPSANLPADDGLEISASNDGRSPIDSKTAEERVRDSHPPPLEYTEADMFYPGHMWADRDRNKIGPLPPFISEIDIIFVIEDTYLRPSIAWRQVALAISKFSSSFVVGAEGAKNSPDMYFLRHRSTKIGATSALKLPGGYLNLGTETRSAHMDIFSEACEGWKDRANVRDSTPRLQELIKLYLQNLDNNPTSTRPMNIIFMTTGLMDYENILRGMLEAATGLDSQKTKMPQEQILIQIVQVGEEAGGGEGLDILDDHLQEMVKNGMRDIVDIVTGTMVLQFGMAENDKIQMTKGGLLDTIMCARASRGISI